MPEREPIGEWSDLSRPPLREQALRTALVGPSGPLGALFLEKSSPSTNAALVTQARDDASLPDLTLIVTDHQSAGRGRLGRAWVTPPRSAITFSLLLRPVGVDPSAWSWVPLLTGLAATRVVRRLAGCPARVKWPNDVLIEGRKLVGILAEALPGQDAVVIGIGMNVSQTAAEIPVDTGTSLVLGGAAVTDRDPVFRALVRELAAVVTRWREAGGDVEASGLAAEVREAMDTLGRRVRVELPGGDVVLGTAEELDQQARLVVTEPDGRRHRISAGDVHHVRTV